MKRGPTDRVDPGRRGFLRGQFLSRKGREDVRRQGRLLGPLPPALPVRLVPQQPCKECDNPCVQACEPGIICLHPPGHAFSGMPFLSFESGACTFCHACVDVCPLVHSQAASEEPLRLGIAALERSICMAWNGVICMSCQTACGYRAISMDPRRRPHIDANQCTGCGACLGICPAKAIRVPAPDIPAAVGA